MIRNLIIFTCLLGGAMVHPQAFAQSRPDLMFCGTSQRTGADLYSGITALNEVSSCSPDANTQALLVTRNGTVVGNGAAWLDYLNNGGIIITEFREAEPVYNEIYGTSYTDENNGDCRDNLLPSEILNPGDAFWGGSPPAPLADNTADSCGSDLQDVVDGEAEVIALGARVPEGTISLAYRSQGAGVLVLAGVDWQDTDPSYAPGSAALFGRLITASVASSAPAQPVPVPSLPLFGLGLLAIAVGLLGRKKLQRRAH